MSQLGSLAGRSDAALPLGLEVDRLYVATWDAVARGRATWVGRHFESCNCGFIKAHAASRSGAASQAGSSVGVDPATVPGKVAKASPRIEAQETGRSGAVLTSRCTVRNSTGSRITLVYETVMVRRPAAGQGARSPHRERTIVTSCGQSTAQAPRYGLFRNADTSEPVRWVGCVNSTRRLSAGLRGISGNTVIWSE